MKMIFKAVEANWVYIGSYDFGTDSPVGEA